MTSTSTSSGTSTSTGSGSGSGPRLVVGFDGSPLARAALRWAADEAARLGGELHVVRTWDFAEAWGLVERSDLRTVPPWHELERAEQERLERDVSAVLGGVVGGRSGAGPAAPVPVRCEASHGEAVPRLLEAARGARLLVLGSRGHSRLAALVVGSVTAACLRRAPCPVVVVPVEPGAERGTSGDDDLDAAGRSGSADGARRLAAVR